MKGPPLLEWLDVATLRGAAAVMPDPDSAVGEYLNQLADRIGTLLELMGLPEPPGPVRRDAWIPLRRDPQT